ncbi:MAG TPA: DUF2130 domain-containing protein [Lacibacter sp.]|nr:DUF2130 domain-containing protein [Lacibacter sp.]HMO89106.1 DUF2130 domain-containing protein [Lacibacter sp.]HMP85799.1 DUF2130 domain-containing protein [Lacibacter sp.]
MPAAIKCPKCGHEFPLEEAVSEEYKQELREQMLTFKKLKEKELQDKETEWARRLEAEKKQVQQQVETELRKTVGDEFRNQVTVLQQEKEASEAKLKEAREKELAYLKREQEIQHREKELELQLQRMLLEERSKLTDLIRKEEGEKNALRETEYQLQLKELQEKLESQKKLAEEMKRKAEQGSMQTQGEAQELLLEEMLRNAFPLDEIQEVGKGVRGADCIQVVHNRQGKECGRIIYESKRTKEFSEQWLEKLKADMRSRGADLAVLVTQALPKDLQQFGEKEGVWVCSFHEVRALAHVLRDGLLKISTALQSQENKGEKMQMLYDYLTGSEFAGQWKAIREGFLSMKLSIQKERDAMEKLWKQREKQLEKVLLNAAHIHGSIEGIAGATINLSLEEQDNDLLLPE